MHGEYLQTPTVRCGRGAWVCGVLGCAAGRTAMHPSQRPREVMPGVWPAGSPIGSEHVRIEHLDLDYLN